MAGASSVAAKLTAMNEQAWMSLGNIAEMMYDPEQALVCYENALRHNPYNTKALAQVAYIYRIREQYAKAAEYFQRFLNIENNNGEIWSALGHCYLLLEELQKAYTAYQQALYHLPNPKDSNLWYGIGILYERYGSHEHALEAFQAVLRMDPGFEKTPEIHFRLGVIYKAQGKHAQALEAFEKVLARPPPPLRAADVRFQMGQIHEAQQNYAAARDAYEQVLAEQPTHAKALQLLGWMHQAVLEPRNPELAVQMLTRSLEQDQQDALSWYLFGRCWMAQQKYRKAYDAYQQAVYREAKSPAFWCSVGILYYLIGQYRDALDAYSRAIRLNPYMSQTWYNLGTLYEACNQIPDSLDAYRRAADLDPANKNIALRMTVLKAAIATGTKREPVKEGEPPKPDDQGIPMTIEPPAPVGGVPPGGPPPPSQQPPQQPPPPPGTSPAATPQQQTSQQQPQQQQQQQPPTTSGTPVTVRQSAGQQAQPRVGQSLSTTVAPAQLTGQLPTTQQAQAQAQAAAAAAAAAVAHTQMTPQSHISPQFVAALAAQQQQQHQMMALVSSLPANVATLTTTAGMPVQMAAAVATAHQQLMAQHQFQQQLKGVSVPSPTSGTKQQSAPMVSSPAVVSAAALVNAASAKEQDHAEVDTKKRVQQFPISPEDQQPSAPTQQRNKSHEERLLRERGEGRKNNKQKQKEEERSTLQELLAREALHGEHGLTCIVVTARQLQHFQEWRPAPRSRA